MPNLTVTKNGDNLNVKITGIEVCKDIAANSLSSSYTFSSVVETLLAQARLEIEHQLHKELDMVPYEGKTVPAYQRDNFTSIKDGEPTKSVNKNSTLRPHHSVEL